MEEDRFEDRILLGVYYFLVLPTQVALLLVTVPLWLPFYLMGWAAEKMGKTLSDC